MPSALPLARCSRLFVASSELSYSSDQFFTGSALADVAMATPPATVKATTRLTQRGGQDKARTFRVRGSGSRHRRGTFAPCQAGFKPLAGPRAHGALE